MHGRTSIGGSASPLLTGLNLAPEGLAIEPGEVVPRRLPDLFAGSPLLILGRYCRPEGSIAIHGVEATGLPHFETVPASVRENPAIAAAWARGQIRQLEDRYVAGDGDRPALEKAIVGISETPDAPCRFTAYVAVDWSQAVNPERPRGTDHTAKGDAARVGADESDCSRHDGSPISHGVRRTLPCRETP